jgi:hypothetical protein
MLLKKSAGLSFSESGVQAVEHELESFNSLQKHTRSYVLALPLLVGFWQLYFARWIVLRQVVRPLPQAGLMSISDWVNVALSD